MSGKGVITDILGKHKLKVLSALHSGLMKVFKVYFDKSKGMPGSGINWSEFKKGFMSVFSPFANVMGKIFSLHPATAPLGMALSTANSFLQK